MDSASILRMIGTIVKIMRRSIACVVDFNRKCALRQSRTHGSYCTSVAWTKRKQSIAYAAVQWLLKTIVILLQLFEYKIRTRIERIIDTLGGVVGRKSWKLQKRITSQMKHMWLRVTPSFHDYTRQRKDALGCSHTCMDFMYFIAIRLLGKNYLLTFWSEES